MLVLDQINKGDGSLRLVAWWISAGLLVLAAGLWRIQVLQGEHYRERQETQSFRSVRVPALRGRILDRNGLPLVDNQPRYRLDVYLDELLPQFAAEEKRLRLLHLAARGLTNPAPVSLWEHLAARLGRKPRRPALSSNEREWLRRSARYSVVSNIILQVNQRLAIQVAKTEEDLFRHWQQQRALPFPLVNRLAPAQVAILTEQGSSIPGVEVDLVPSRLYPHGPLAAHVLGYVKSTQDPDPAEDRDFDYRLRDYRGEIGLEGAYDRTLRGVAGAKSILINSSGYRHRQGEILIEAPVPGDHLVTTLDLPLQRAVEKSLGMVSGDERGAVVVLDVRNGDILAIASAPSFDPNGWIDGIRRADYERLLDPKMRPMFNRATYGSYNPGSTFKVVTALACLDAGVLTPASALERMHTLGYYRLGRNHVIDDTAPAGDYDFNRAFIKSSNAYFIDHGLRLGLGPLLAYARRLHLGEKTGLRIQEETSGILPEASEIPQAFAAGKTANLSIGQELTVTPLQLALVFAAVANGGSVWWPRLVDRIEPGEALSSEPPQRVRPGQVRSRIDIPRPHLALVHAAMRDDVALDDGTGRAARVPGFAVCGKTGTAEVKSGRKLVDRITWFASFAPFESPRYAVVVMVESGGSGGRTCAPVAQRIYEHLRDRERGPLSMAGSHP
ncbi:MAG: penicillin-binding protein 2 [Verrucomicrobiota bacterium]